MGAVTGASKPSDRRHWRYRANIAARTIAATVGSYAVAAAFSTALARVVPLDRAQAAMLATIAGMVVAPAVIVWCFLTSSAARACCGVAAATIIFAILAWSIGAPA
jgi:hypothetical protein